ncbi:uncharacterized protein BP01DRAFT_390499 [Aspergillus saccharolyticus JOP 1030-1]|uniref:SprT-like domain-containing protein n=1 Tax=Aspergillus saccharolyticus JOP 1030-1 TaxID=1450539 RepID=A0A318ZKB2_9EURO|nr:hypothetical protein BP01DRAFT_390499 [Aspergillus saccharolyticus JOP 1030-1]PYH46824.1 hypothetical protein BP01DRAFT_390499 [Aspergillus saccharolyticus JOP 1030-1]
MARLNPNSPIKPAIFRPQAKPITKTVVREVSQYTTSSASEAEDDHQKQWIVTARNGATKSDRAATIVTTTERPQQQQQQQQQRRVRHQRTPTVSSGIFDIFSDSDGGFSETEYSSARSSTRSLCEPTRTTDPLRLSQINSLSAASLSQPPPSPRRSRPTRKQETYNYDKENDPIEHEQDEDRDVPSLSRNPSDASSSRSTTRRSADARPTLGRGTTNNRQRPASYRRSEPESADDESEQDNDEDSMADFIVSDNEDLSYHNTSEDEAEDEIEKPAQPSPSPPRTAARKRLFRGRRPAQVEAEIKKDLPEDADTVVPYNVNLKLEPTLPVKLTMVPPKLEAKPRRLFQDEINITEKLNHLHLDNNDPASQLQQELFTSGQYDDSPVKRSQANKSSASATGTTRTSSTPPSSPSKGRLRSPTKDRLRVHIPPTPHRESVDAFWTEEVTTNWISQHSPCKVEDLLREFDEESDAGVIDVDIMPRGATRGSQLSTPTRKPPSKTALKRAETEKKKAEKARKQAFDDSKAGFAADFFKALDDAVTKGKVQELAAATGGVDIVWSKTLQTTAGRATWKRVTPKQQRESDAGSDKETPMTTTSAAKHYVKIELAERIIDCEERIIKTVAHEYCHLTNYMISEVHDNPHGESFKAWGRKCMEAMKDHPIYGGGRVEISTKHNYKIDYKYVWSCVTCTQTYGRHSKSINPLRSRCGRCHGLLTQIKPKPRSVSPRKKQPLSLLPNSKGLLADVAKAMEEVAAVTTLDE